MAKDNKFLNLLETYQSRYEQAGFLVGDVFKFNDNFKSHGDYKAMTQDIKDLLDSYIESGLHLRVVAVQHNPEVVVIAQDHTGGRLVGKVSVTPSLGQPVSFGDNLAPIPDSAKRDDKVNIKPEEVAPVKFDNQEEDEEVVAESTYTQQYL